ncbi:MAG: DUF4097 family beta strand repeat-containing protein [Planctomycetota bacterium]
MKTTASLSVILMLATSVGCHFNVSFNGRNFDYQGKTASTMQQDSIADSIKTLTVESEFCDVTVAASEEPAAWAFDGKVWAKQQEVADDLVSSLRVTTDQVDDSLTLRIMLPEDEENKLRGVEATLNISIPAATTVSIRNSHGDAIVEGTNVSTTVNNRHGQIRFTSIEGESSFDCEHGETVGVGLVGTSKIRSRHGEVKVKDASAAINLDVRHSDVKLASLESTLTINGRHGNADISGVLTSIQGDIQHYDLDLAAANDDFKSIAVTSQHGDVKLTLPETATPSILASANFGDVTSDFDATGGTESTIKVDVQHGDVQIRKAAQ